jgi:pimeloyl-ACP methyl ester carboxylesterase
MPKERRVELPEMHMHYVEAGATGPAVVLIHGLTDGLKAYVPILDALKDEAHVYAIDLRGHGASSRTPGAYRVVDYTRDVEAFLRDVVRAPAVLVGCSLGALIACCAAARREAEIQGILLEDPPLYVGQMPDLGETLFYAFYEYLTQLLPEHHRANGTVDDLLPKVRHPLVSEPLQRVLAENLHELDLETVRPAMEGSLFDDFDPDDKLPRIRCPVRAIVARGDPGGDAVRDLDIDRMAERVPRFTHVVWDNTIHAVHYQRPTEMVSEIRTFLEHIRNETSSPSRKENHGQGT